MQNDFNKGAAHARNCILANIMLFPVSLIKAKKAAKPYGYWILWPSSLRYGRRYFRRNGAQMVPGLTKQCCYNLCRLIRGI